ncbi:MAG: alpha amylase C-terminal domain-containing protein [Bacilli bacterium]|nr:alpha amylase C-terminal domain-containing protein [Bacilli bacterium]
MKKNLLALPLLAFLLTGCSFLNINKDDDPDDDDPTGEHGGQEGGGDDPTGGDPTDTGEQSKIDSIQDMNILHAWNWRLNDIKSRLTTIKNAGYGAIQISPMQPKVDKSGYSNQSTSSQWWKLYQPLAFKIAEGDETFLGNKDDLVSLCSSAKNMGLKIIVDVVSNHLAGTNNNYSSQVYTQYPLHNYGATNDNSVEAVVRGHIGLPDLDTSTDQVQQDVLSMMKSYVDCGVSGFRFDAAKHIETPDDGNYASNYWPTVLDGTSNYAKSKNIDVPYYYGEVLNTCGTGRKFSSYTKMMSICDNNQGTSIVDAVYKGKINLIKTTYNTGADPDHLVLWAESHDTYANTSGYNLTNSYSKEVINKAYMIQASRKDAATLYLARPSSMGATICSIDDNSGWKNSEVTAINKFHARYVDKSETITTENGCFINIRGSGSYAGAAIVNVGSTNSKETLTVKGLANGNYVDLISNNKYEVKNSKVTVSFTNGGCILIPSDGSEQGGGDTTTYNSSVILKGYNTSKSYLGWVWQGSGNGHWVDFSADHDAIGINLSSGDNYIVVEFASGTTSSNANWSNKIKQTDDLSYGGSQIILNYNELSWK